ncbi:MAG: gamma-glutamyl-gamma-aminobutyrate hydrolase family protein [Pseudomonadota bacterium]
MKNRLVMVRHHHNALELDDVACRVLRARGFELEHVHPHAGDPLGVPADDVAGTIVYGGGQNVTELERFPYLRDEMQWMLDCQSSGIPVLGICLGAQLLAAAHGADVMRPADGLCEFGYYPVFPVDDSGFVPAEGLHVTEAHFEAFELPAGAVHLARSEAFPNQAFRVGDNVYGLQFHPEVNTEVFRDWQADYWTPHFYASPGSQSETESLDLHYRHTEAQGAWFEALLLNLFGTAPAAA